MNKVTGCKYKDFCRDCSDLGKKGFCGACNSYKSIDGGYGHCVYLPVPEVVPWCRDVCSQYDTRVRTEMMV